MFPSFNLFIHSLVVVVVVVVVVIFDADVMTATHKVEKTSRAHARDLVLARASPSSSDASSAKEDEEDDSSWRLGFPAERTDDALAKSNARLNRKWRAFRRTRMLSSVLERGDFVRAFTRANGVGEMDDRRACWLEWSGANVKKREAVEGSSYAEMLADANANADMDAFKSHFEQIDMDLPRTFPEHKCFAEHEGVYFGPLRNVLRATTTRLKDGPLGGYVQGMNYLAGFLLCVYDGDEESAYWILCCVIEDMYSGYYASGLKSLRADLDELDFRFSHVSSEAHGKLESMGLAVKYFTARWLMCALIGCATPPVVMRVWDLIFVDSDREPRETLMRCSLAILALQSPFIRAANDMNASVECIREGGLSIDNIEAYLQRVSDLREINFPSAPAQSQPVATPSRKRTRYEPPPTPARVAMTPVANTLYSSLVSFFSPTPSKDPAQNVKRATAMRPKRLWSFEEQPLRKTPPTGSFRRRCDESEECDASRQIEMSTPPKRKRQREESADYVTSPVFQNATTRKRSPLYVR